MTVSSTDDPMCQVCAFEGGYRLKPGGTIYPPTRSVPPYTGKQRWTGPSGERLADAWMFEPMCAVHAHAVTERLSQEQEAARRPA